ncbi:MAG: hypothetical protein KME60_02250 [Cyanomargarita calcarea GSE-NOS-MK-12-04C]|uniref:Uncharacterized protein n=1 Tax=Cyanomargarita calcarea GSE-NOS-MK-12-04C TaxID=2839659 RepID=A0A951QJR3_9CYAN|nr:hypothetical protein [Cyanomargarita calcarea GSE-NOS-MK-12-04C]
MLDGQRDPFVERNNSLGVFSIMPYLPIALTYRKRSVDLIYNYVSGDRQ